MSAHQPLLPSYAKLILTLIVIVLGTLVPVNVLKVKVDIQARLAESDQPRTGSEAAPAYRLFDEYPHAAADLAAHPIETRAALWVSFRHLSDAERAAALAAWRTVSRLRPLADGLFRLDCSGPPAAAIARLLARYPYAIAPGADTDPHFSAAYRRVAGTSPFRVCVVRGDWLTAALAGEPAAAERLGVETSSLAAEQYRAAAVTADAVLAPFPPESRGRVAVPSTVTRRAIEAADGGGHSLFVRWATATGVGVPVY